MADTKITLIVIGLGLGTIIGVNLFWYDVYYSLIPGLGG